MMVAVAVWMYAAYFAAAFVAGAVVAAVAIFLFARRMLRRKLGGLLDLTVLSKS